MHIVRWQPYMNHHQFFLWSEVERLTDKLILFVLSKDLIGARREQGWKPFNLDEKKYIFLESVRDGMRIIRDTPDSIHAFQSFFGPNKIYIILILYALWKGVKVVVTAEPYSIMPVGYFREEPELIAKLKTLFRPIIYRLTAGLIKLASTKSKICVLAISDIAKKQFTKAGVSPDTVFPFGYFIPSNLSAFEKKNKTTGLRIIFLGSLLRIKGFDLLLNAFELLEDNETPVSLDIYGAGNFEKFIRNRNFSFVQYKGIISPEKSQGVILEYDALILPSLHDGWGVVVNEALLHSVPVIISDQSGASCLIKATGAGIVFKSGSLERLTEVLQLLASDTFELQKIKQCAANFDKSNIAPETGAKYFIQVMEYFFWNSGERPRLFWDKGDQLEKSI